MLLVEPRIQAGKPAHIDSLGPLPSGVALVRTFEQKTSGGEHSLDQALTPDAPPKGTQAPPERGERAASFHSKPEPASAQIPPRATSCPAITFRWISLVPSPTIISGASRKYRSTSYSVE